MCKPQEFRTDYLTLGIRRVSRSFQLSKYTSQESVINAEIIFDRCFRNHQYQIVWLVQVLICIIMRTPY